MNNVVKASIIAALAPSPLLAAPEVTYLSQSRSVVACGFDPFGCPYYSKVSDQRTAPDFGPFVEYLTVGQCAPGSANQDSVLESVAAHFYLEAGGSKGNSGNICGGTSTAEILFEIESTTILRLQGNMKQMYCGPGDASLELTGPTLAIAYSIFTTPWSFDKQHVLAPGVYSLAVEASGGANTNGMCIVGAYSIDADLDFRCVADCDASGSLDIDDFVCFQTMFALGDKVSDCDASGSLTIDDFVCFQTQFALGC